MSIQLNCPKCGKQYTLKDEMRGKTVRCKECLTPFPIIEPEPEPEPEVMAELAEPPPVVESAPKAKRKEKSVAKTSAWTPGLIIAAAIAGVLLLFTCCGGVSLTGYYLFGRDKHGGAGSAGGLDGTYKVVTGQMLGQSIPQNLIASKFGDYVFSGNTLSYKLDGKGVTATIKLNPTANPPTMDVTSENQTIYWIYKLEGDTLTLCMGGLDTNSRPKDFNAKDALAMMVLKRQ